MQDALSRLVWNERTDAVSKFANKRPWMQVVPDTKHILRFRDFLLFNQRLMTIRFGF